MMDRIMYEPYQAKVISALDAAALIQDQSVVGVSGFTKAGDSKSVLPAFAKLAKENHYKITLLSGASLGYDTDADLAKNGALHKRMPFQADPILRNSINSNELFFVDQHLGETAELLQNGHSPKINTAIIEATFIDTNGYIVPSTSLGNSATFAEQADQVIIEINTSIPISFKGIHDIYLHKPYPNREILRIQDPADRIGKEYMYVDPSKVVGIVFTNKPDSPARIAPPDDQTTAISKHILQFLSEEVQAGKLTKSLLPLQAGIGKIANAVLSGFVDSSFDELTMYSEVLQDSTFELFDVGKLRFASASSITVSDACRQHFMSNFENYKDKILLRPQNISNAAEVIRRLGIIAINTAIEFDLYGNVNSTHLGGTRMMNGIGGSGDFARNAFISIFVCPAISKKGAISHVVPMVSHVDHTEHDVDILVTDQGLADLRGLAPTERAPLIIEKCVHPIYRDQMKSYYQEALTNGGQTPHILPKAFSWHQHLEETGTMQLN